MKSQFTNHNDQTIHKNNDQNKTEGMQPKPFNLEDRTLLFSKGIIQLCKKISHDVINVRLIGQLIDASGSVGANYREANEALSKKDFVYRLKITRKECKETSFWLELLKEANPNFTEEVHCFVEESKELRNIFTSIIQKAG